MTDGSAVRATRLGPAFDLLAAYDADGGVFFERDGLGVAASGPADTARAASIAELGGSVVARLREGWDHEGPAPVALGGLPFAPGPVSLAAPARVVRRTDEGETWLIERGVRGTATPFSPQRVVGDLPHGSFRPAQLREVPTVPGYEDAVAGALERIRAGGLEKVVLARTLEVDAGRPLDAKRLLHRLRAVEPHGYAFAVPSGSSAVLVGASPELLVSLRGGEVCATPLAGTAPRSGDPDEDRANAEALSASAKNREEHAVVVRAVASALARYCEPPSWDPEPVLLETANVWHLATRFVGRVRDPSVTVLDLVAALHPTPAVCGTPTDMARATIAELEPFDRGRYAGPVGWIDANGEGEWAIALRCAELRGGRATLFAGAGIVAGSEPASEADETGRKFQAFLDSLRWG
ncbi:MAG: isochorismate synthase [Actinomycetota bacterium]